MEEAVMMEHYVGKGGSSLGMSFEGNVQQIPVVDQDVKCVLYFLWRV